MARIEFTVHEFMTIMGMLNERAEGAGVAADSVYHEWKERFQELDKRLERLDMMDRADMLFDGKVTIDEITAPHLDEVIGVVANQIALEQSLIDDGDPDADPEEVEIWESLKTRLDDIRAGD